DSPEEEGVKYVEEEIDRVIPEGAGFPKVVFDPECGVNERIVLRRRGGFEPDVAQASGRAERLVFGDVLVIVPDVGRSERGEVGGDGREDEARGDDQILKMQMRPERRGLGRKHGWRLKRCIHVGRPLGYIPFSCECWSGGCLAPVPSL